MENKDFGFTGFDNTNYGGYDDIIPEKVADAAVGNSDVAESTNIMSGAEGIDATDVDGREDEDTRQSATRVEWERQQREIQDREWQQYQRMCNLQLAHSRENHAANRHGIYSGEGDMYYNQDGQSAYNAQNTRPPVGVFDATGGNPSLASAAGAKPSGGDKRQKRKSRLQLAAAALAGAFVAAVIFATGFFAAGYFDAEDRQVNGKSVAALESKDAEEQQGRLTVDGKPSYDADTKAGDGDPVDAAAESGTNSSLGNGASNNTGAAGPSGEQQSDGKAADATDGDIFSIFPGGVQPGSENNSEDDGVAGDEGADVSAEAQTDGAQQTQQSKASTQPSTLTVNPPTGGDMAITGIYQKVYPSIVGIRITFSFQGYQFGGMLLPGEEQSGEGSGIVIRKDGYIMTNHHVVAEVIDGETNAQMANTKIEVFLPDDDNAYPAKIVGFDSNTDLAVLKIEKTNLQAAELGDSDKLSVGEYVVAIGNPGGMEYMSSVTFGIISGLNRSIQEEGYKEIKLIQTDAAINPGNSGGALINSKGQVIGVNSIKIAANAFEGLGFAIPINEAVKICEDLMNYKYVTGRPLLGISADQRYTEEIAERSKMPKGVYVASVEESGPSSSVIKTNDIIVKFNGVNTPNFDALETEKNKSKPGDKVKVQVYRDYSANNLSGGKYVDVEVILGENTMN